MARLTIPSPHGTWRQASVDPLRLVKNRLRAAKSNGRLEVDAEGFIRNGTAITVLGTNRYTGQPVNELGLTFEAWLVSKAINAQFPDCPTKINYAVDRNRRGSSSLSDHAKGGAIDIITQKFDGKLGISRADVAWGEQLFAWLLAEYKARRLPGEYVLFHGRIARRNEGWVERDVNPGADPHNDHLHTSVRVEDRRKWALGPEKEARRNLRFRWVKPFTGEDVTLVQRVVGAAQTGTFDKATATAVRLFQRKHGLVVDGKVGPQTWAKIDEVLAP